MVSQNNLIVLLLALVVILVILLVHRIRGERKHSAAIDGLRPEELDALFGSNAQEGSVAAVARRVSDILIGPCQCDTIVFLRKRRGNLICNYTHGLTDEARRGLLLPHSKALLDHLKESFLPRKLTGLRGLLPEPFSSRLSGIGVDAYFPVFWKDNLYGVYFVKSNLDTSHAFRLLAGTLAETLSATYHVKWHESKRETLTKELAVSDRSVPESMSGVKIASSLAALIKHRKSESLIPRIVATLKKDLDLERVALVYGESDSNTGMTVVGEGMTKSVGSPDSAGFKTLIKRLDGNSALSLKEISLGIPPLSKWSEELQHSGLQYIAPFTLSKRRTGVLAFSPRGKSDRVGDRLRQLQSHAADLVENAEAYEQIEELSYTDNLTNLANRRYLIKRLDEEMSRAGRYKRKLVLIIFDLDQLKMVNDRYGHHAGDTVLRRLGQVLHDSIRSIDIVARYGGDEFCVVMPEADADRCRLFMSRLQSEVARTPVTIEQTGESISNTISLGGAIFPDHGTDSDSLLRAADEALLRAKEGGRNRAVMYDDLNADQS